jgi:hypothetical protein
VTGPHDDDADRDPAGAGRSDRDRDGGELNAEEVDERFKALIAGIDDSPQWPKESDTDDGDDSPAEQDDEPEPRIGSAATAEAEEPTLLELWDTDLPDDDEDSYQPPPPPPVPKPSLPAILGVLLIIGGLALVVSPTLLDVGAELGMLTGIAAFLGGSAMLVWRLRPEPGDEDDDPDNGAIV